MNAFLVTSLLSLAVSSYDPVMSIRLSIGSTKDCSKITGDQAKFPVEYTMVRADQVCCIANATRTTNITAECCVPAGKECTIKPDVSCCNQLSCVPDEASKTTICKQPQDRFTINRIREDKRGCADPRKPLHLLLDMSIRARADRYGKYTNYSIKDISYCCDARLRGRSRVLSMEKYCCGTGFAICDDVRGSKVAAGSSSSSSSKLKCCGDPSQSRRESNCGAFVDPTFGKTIVQEEEQNKMFLSKKTGKSAKDIPYVPMPVIDGYGFCHFSHSGRFDVTRDLSKNPGSDIFGLCKEAKAKKCPKGKKVMYQFQDDSNICCTRGGHMHDSDEDHVHMDCCVSNYNTLFNPTHVNPFLKHGHDFCEHVRLLSCCEGICKRDSRRETRDDVTMSDDVGARCVGVTNDSFVYCGGDYLFDTSDSDFVKASALN